MPGFVVGAVRKTKSPDRFGLSGVYVGLGSGPVSVSDTLVH